MAADEKLDVYRAKRRFDETPEPSGDAASMSGARYAIQKHDATRLHYDLRLELDGVLLSWAVTRGPSLDPSEKRLAVRTEDHPIDYAGFEGVIPSGYGEGAVMLWDRGTWEPIGDPHEGLEKGKLAFALHGERLVGRWALVRMRPRNGEKRENWLMIKELDDEVSRRGDVLKTYDRSVASDRTMAEIAKSTTIWRSGPGGGPAKRAGTEPRAKSASRKKPAAKEGPGFVEPQLATLVEAPPDGDDWLFEIKFDGYRGQLSVGRGRATIYTRAGLDWTERFASIAEAALKLDLHGCLVDGEIVALDGDGRSDFGLLHKALEEGRSRPLSLFAFDLLVDGGKDIRTLPLDERKARLKKRLKTARGPIYYTDDFEDGAGALEKLTAAGFEGVVGKRRSAPYRSGRSKGWLKIKGAHRQEFVIVGASPSDKKDRPFASLLMATSEDGALRYAGRVGSGFGEREFGVLGAAFAARWRDKPTIENPPPGPIGRKARWLEPGLVAEIGFAGYTPDDQIRHGRFIGLREDKPALAVTRERAAAAKAAPAPKRTVEVPGIRLTHPERELYPGVTKQDVAAYLDAIAPKMLPFATARAISLVRCPEGIDGERFFQKHANQGLPEAVRRRTIKDGKGEPFEALYVEDREGLASTAQVSALEIHIAGARLDRPDLADRIVFDLDPDETVPFSTVRDAAFEVRDALAALELESFALLTGGKGVHVVAPVARKRGWDEIAAFARGLAERFADADPERFVATMTKAKRVGKIFIDHFRNARAATAIAPYSLRARPGAPVACPVTWDELKTTERADAATIGDLGRMLTPDPWKGYETAAKQSVSARAIKALADA